MAHLPNYSRLKKGRKKPPYAAINLIQFFSNYRKDKPMELTRADICAQIGISKSHLSHVLVDPVLRPIIDEELADMGVRVVRKGAGGRDCFVWTLP